MDYREINKIFHRDGYGLAHQFLGEKVTEVNLIESIRQLYQAIDGLLEAFLNRTRREGRPAACMEGCSWCCQQAVFAVTHEFFFLQNFITGQLKESDRRLFLENARKKAAFTGGQTVEEQLGVRSPCPFLRGGSCAVYRARPMACRIYLSSSVDACIEAHDHPGDTDRFPELFEFPLRAGRMLNQGYVAYLKQSGLPTTELPLEHGYLYMEENGQTMAGWIDQARSSD